MFKISLVLAVAEARRNTLGGGIIYPKPGPITPTISTTAETTSLEALDNGKKETEIADTVEVGKEEKVVEKVDKEIDEDSDEAWGLDDEETTSSVKEKPRVEEKVEKTKKVVETKKVTKSS
jgi:hypothetical protein